jgi:hypothetical protein
MTERPKVKK